MSLCDDRRLFATNKEMARRRRRRRVEGHSRSQSQKAPVSVRRMNQRFLKVVDLFSAAVLL